MKHSLPRRHGSSPRTRDNCSPKPVVEPHRTYMLKCAAWRAAVCRVAYSAAGKPRPSGTPSPATSRVQKNSVLPGTRATNSPIASASSISASCTAPVTGAGCICSPENAGGSWDGRSRAKVTRRLVNSRGLVVPRALTVSRTLLIVSVERWFSTCVRPSGSVAAGTALHPGRGG